MARVEEFFAQAIKDGQSKKQKEKVAISRAIRAHSERNKDQVRRLLSTRFPSEPVNIQEYRLANLPFVTKAYFDKVYFLLSKIQTAPEFSISYPDANFEEYAKNHIDLNEIFSRVLRTMLVDPNAYYLYYPSNDGYVYLSEDIVYDENELVIIKNQNGYTDQYIIYYVDRYMLARVERNALIIEEETMYLNGIFPLIKLGGNWANIQQEYYESFMQGAIDSWDNALIMYSDLLIGIKQHIFPEKYRYVTDHCKHCDGTGRFVKTLDNDTWAEPCAACGGSGLPATGVLSEHHILLTGSNDLLTDNIKIPSPPVGYVEKDIESVDFVNGAYRQFLQDGLAALSMEFLMTIGLNQSGISKEIDRTEVNSFLQKVCSRLVYVIEKSHELAFSYYTNDIELSYSELKINYERAKPSIKVPHKFDSLFYESHLDGLAAAKAANASPAVLSAIEKRYIDDTFLGDERKKLLLASAIDPLPGYSLENKIELLNNDLVSQLDAYVSVHIYSLIEELMLSNARFLNLKDFEKQKNYVYELAKAKNGNSVLQDFQRRNKDGGLPPQEVGPDIDIPEGTEGF